MDVKKVRKMLVRVALLESDVEEPLLFSAAEYEFKDEVGKNVGKEWKLFEEVAEYLAEVCVDEMWSHETGGFIGRF